MILACQKEPTTEADCFLQTVKTGISNEVAGGVRQACRLKFEKPEPTSVALSYEQLSALDGRAGPSALYDNYYDVTVYNSLDSITVTEIDIDVVATVSGKTTTKTYRNKVSISPKSTTKFRFDFVRGGEGATYRWNISGAKGWGAS